MIRLSLSIKPVLLKEAIDALVNDPDGHYVDGTFGRGGHSAELLDRLTANGSVTAIDKDLEAIAAGRNQVCRRSASDLGSW
jgi:16S rRNA (cytosine1402-N4)-methyltransferase